MKRKDELSPARIDREYPHQVALPAEDCKGSRYEEIRAFCADLSLSPRGHSVVRDDDWWVVHCFAAAEDAERFRAQFGGIPFDPKSRGRGARWHQWRAD